MESKAPSSSVKIETLRGVIEPVLRAHGVVPVEITFKPEQGGWVLRVTIEFPKEKDASAGITLDLCAEVSRDLSSALDVAEAIEHPFNLEVSSPGAERPLMGIADFERFQGKSAKVMLRLPTEDGQRVLRGPIERVEGEQIVMSVDGKEKVFPIENVKRAHLVLMFGAGAHQKKTKRHARAMETE